MRTRTRRLGVIAGILFLLVAAVAIGVRFIDTDRLVATALERARQATGYTIEVGETGLRLSWTGVVLRIAEVRVAAPDSSQTASVGEIDTRFALWPLLKKRVEVSRLTLRDAEIATRLLPAGDDADAPANPALAVLAVERWEIERGRYTWTREGARLTVEGLEGGGTLNMDPETGTRGTGDLRTGAVLWEADDRTVRIPEARGDWSFLLDPATTRLELPRFELEAGPLSGSFTGRYDRVPGGWGGTLSGSVDPAPLEALAALAAPPGSPDVLAEWDLDGTVSIDSLQVVTTPDAEPAIRATTRLRELSGRLPSGRRFTGGEFTVTAALPGPVGIDGACRLDGAPFSLTGTLRSRDGETVDISLRAHAADGGARALLPAGSGVELERGSLNVDLNVLATMPVSLDRPPRITGTVAWNDLSGRHRDRVIERTTGELRFLGYRAELAPTELRIGSTDFRVTGSVADFRDPVFRFDLVSDRIDLDEWTTPAEKGGPASARASGDDPESDEVALLPPVPLDGSFRIDRVRTRGIEIGKVAGRLSAGLDGVELVLDEGSAAGGTLGGRVRAVPAGNGAWSYQGGFDLEHVAVREVLAAVLGGAGRLEGLGTTHIELSGRTEPGTAPWRALEARGELVIRDGSVLNVPALNALARRLSVKEVSGDRWPFQDLGARFHVRDGRVLMDTLRIEQVGVVWSLAGSFGSDGVEARGTARLDPERVRLPDEVALVAAYITEADGKIPVDFLVGGTPGKPVVNLDWPSLTRRAVEAASREQQDELLDRLGDVIEDKGTVDRLKDILKKKKP